MFLPGLSIVVKRGTKSILQGLGASEGTANFIGNAAWIGAGILAADVGGILVGLADDGDASAVDTADHSSSSSDHAAVDTHHVASDGPRFGADTDPKHWGAYGEKDWDRRYPGITRPHVQGTQKW